MARLREFPKITPLYLDDPERNMNGSLDENLKALRYALSQGDAAARDREKRSEKLRADVDWWRNLNRNKILTKIAALENQRPEGPSRFVRGFSHREDSDGGS